MMNTNASRTAKIENLAKALRAEGIDTDALHFEITKMEAESREEADEDGRYTVTEYRGTCTIVISECIKATMNIVDDDVDCEFTDTEILIADDDDDLTVWLENYNVAPLAEYLTLVNAKVIGDAQSDARYEEADAADFSRDAYRYYGVSRRDF
jgi:hypothetical protein